MTQIEKIFIGASIEQLQQEMVVYIQTLKDAEKDVRIGRQLMARSQKVLSDLGYTINEETGEITKT